MRGEVAARALDRAVVDRARRALGLPGQRAKRVGERRRDVDGAEIADGFVDVGEEGREHARGRRRSLYGVGDEWERRAVEGVVNELRRDVERAVAESVLGPGRPVVDLVRMQDHELSGTRD